MTNDILEQLVEDYLREDGYFTMHNIPYRPKAFKQTHSDIDVIAFNPKKTGIDKVVVVSCKSWQGGLNVRGLLRDLRERPDTVIQGKSREKIFREIAMRDWSHALKEKVFELTGEKSFLFYIAVTKTINGDPSEFESFPLFAKNLSGCKIKILPFADMVNKIYPDIKTSVYHSTLGRTLQLIKASGVEMKE